MNTNQITPTHINKKTQDFRVKYKTEVLLFESRNAGIGSKKATALSVTA